MNRVRRAALSIGFYDLLQGLIKILEREVINYQSLYTPESILQINHCINCLSSIEYFDYRKDIQPFVMLAHHAAAANYAMKVPRK